MMGFPGGSVVNNPPAMQEMQVQSLGWEDSLQEKIATCSGISARIIPQSEKPGRLQSMRSQKSDMTKYTLIVHTHLNSFPLLTILKWASLCAYIYTCYLLYSLKQTPM